MDILDVPSISITPTSIRVNASGAFKATCSGSRFANAVYWDTQELTSEIFLSSSRNVQVQDLIVKNASVFDNGWVSCIAENEIGRYRKTLQIIIKCKYMYG